MFGGQTYDSALDAERLSSQLGRVYAVMRDGEWHGLSELSARCGGSEASVSARLRDLRKPKFGSHAILRQRVDAGLWMYWMVV